MNKIVEWYFTLKYTHSNSILKQYFMYFDKCIMYFYVRFTLLKKDLLCLPCLKVIKKIVWYHPHKIISFSVITLKTLSCTELF